MRTFSFKKNGSVTVTVVRADGQSDSASFTLEVMPHGEGTFRADGDWIFKKLSIASAMFTITLNGEGLVGPDEILIDNIDLWCAIRTYLGRTDSRHEMCKDSSCDCGRRALRRPGVCVVLFKHRFGRRLSIAQLESHPMSDDAAEILAVYE